MSTIYIYKGKDKILIEKNELSEWKARGYEPKDADKDELIIRALELELAPQSVLKRWSILRLEKEIAEVEV